MPARVGISFEGTDKVSPQIKSIHSGIQGLAAGAKSSILTGVGLGAGITAFNLMGRAVSVATDFLKDSIQAAIDDEASVARLTAALRANVPAWDGRTDSIERTIAAGQKLGFTDDETRESLTLLSAATNDVAKAQELHTTAMDLARFKGISLAAASEALVKVESGRYRLLASLGIVLREGATATEALAAVQAVASGSAEAFGDTTAGAMLAAQIAFEETGESIGREFLPVISELARVTRDDVVPGLNDLFDAVKQVPWGDIVDGVMAVFQPTAAMTDHLEALAAAERQAGEDARGWIIDMRNAAIAAEEAAVAIGESLGGALISELKSWHDETRAAALDQVLAYAKGILDGQSSIRAAWAMGQKLSEEVWTQGEKAAYLHGVLQSSQMLAGMNDPRPEVSEFWRAMNVEYTTTLRTMGQISTSGGLVVVNNLVTKLREGVKPAGTAGTDTGASYNTGLSSAPKTGGTILKGVALAQTSNIAGFWTAGNNAGKSYAAGLAAASSAVKSSGTILKNAATSSMNFSGSPPYTLSKKIGRLVGESWASGLSSSLQRVATPTAALPGGGIGTGPAIGMTPGGGEGGVIHTHVYLDGRQIAEAVDRRHYYGASKHALAPRG